MPKQFVNGLFQKTGGILPGRSMHNLSYSKMFDCDMGQLIPVMCDEVVPGDHFKIGNEMVLRFTPLVAPMMHEVNVYVHYFFVPYRLLWSNWEKFITGGFDGNNVDVQPEWLPGSQHGVGTLWDYFGFPDAATRGVYPVAYPLYAYNFIYNTYYRDENLQTELDITLDHGVLLRNWTKDYFTSALPWQQRGTAPALPISGIVNTNWSASHFGAGYPTNPVAISTDALHPLMTGGGGVGDTNLGSFFAGGTVNLAAATTFNVRDLRLAFQIQRWMERNARAGVRYTEFLKAHFGVSPTDERLDRPEYLGGSKSPVIISEVLQTSGTGLTGGTTPQGNMAGHGITVDKNFCVDYHVQEFGLIMGIMSIMPKPAYCQGINKQWLRKTRYDYYSPEFANLSEQAIIRAEIYASGVEADNLTIFGYQGRYDEMRFKPNMFAGNMRNSNLDYWHLGRIFGSAPLLNSQFIQMNGTTAEFKRCFAVTSMPVCIINFGNLISAVRPIPIMAEPGLIDHD